MNNEIRIPRPLGTTNLAKSGLIDILEERIIDSFFVGMFPYRGQGLDLYSFSSLYGVNLKRLKGRISQQLQEDLLEGSSDLRSVLETRRLGMLGGVISRLGRADFETERVLRFLGARVYGSGNPDPMLLKEINSAITNQIRLTESELKGIALLNQSLDSIPVDVSEGESQLTQTQILERLAQIERDPSLLLREIEGTPDLDPIPVERGRNLKENYNKLASHDYQKLPDLDEAPEIEDIPILPR
jgi:hypothetical protein